MTSKKTDMPGDLESIESVSSESSSSEEEESSSESESSGSSTGSSFDDSDESGSDDDDSENRDETEEINKMIRKESKDVIMWREIVTAMLVITAALATITTYVFLTREQGDDFTNGFAQVSMRIQEAMTGRIFSFGSSTEALSDTLTTYALATTIASIVPWPYVTLPSDQFEQLVTHVHTLSAWPTVWTSPLVENVPRWEAYSVKKVPDDYPRSEFIFSYGEDGKAPVNGNRTFAPIHQISHNLINPETNESLINYDIFTEPGLKPTFDFVQAAKHSQLSGFINLTIAREAVMDLLADEPLSLMVQPVFHSFENKTVSAFVQSIVQWSFVFANILEENEGAYCIVKPDCGEESITIKITGNSSVYLGMGDQRLEAFDKHADEVALLISENPLSVGGEGSCQYTVTIYPSEELHAAYDSSKAQIYTAIIGAVFFLMAATFFSYDSFVKRRNDKVIQAAARSNAIVSSLFPSNIRDRLFKAADDKANDQQIPKAGLKSYLRDDGDINGNGKLVIDSKPLADLFPETTIMFADIAGFTAWSSVREPTQVFILLETLYAAFDLIARRRRIFKVETIGDCYVAVAGLPEPRKDHAVAMSKFSTDILKKAHNLTRRLECTLGPDTGDLSLRIGLHSGPVTAGVLRGERARFQLFGDTMNTAARMEHNGVRGKIQVSQETADLLIAAGKSHWLKSRDDTIIAKGKGELNTYWLDANTDSRNGSSRNSDNTDSGADSMDDDGDDNEMRMNLKKSQKFSDKTERLIDWNVDILVRLLQQIIAYRDISSDDDLVVCGQANVSNPFDEVKEIISLPEFKETRKMRDPAEVKIPDDVVGQLRSYVSTIAGLYKENSFHNFEHASHVTMSVTKLLSRIVAPSDVLDDYRDRARKDLVSTLHDHTYGITSDPLTQFACVFSALIHDTDHSGAPNTQLVKENIELAERYGGKSVAEQNSIDLAWGLLMDAKYKELRGTICGSTVEFNRFRQLVVNTVMATDIMDADLKMLRNLRWTKAFSEGGTVSDPDPRDQINRKATIVIEHLIQASDVSHTMQHWHIYRQWNERFFVECYEAFRAGRSQTDPSVGWYQGEMGFFDFYIIPLAKKLKDCGVFGVSSDEYLQYALKNRKEWEQRGQEVVAEMMQKINS